MLRISDVIALVPSLVTWVIFAITELPTFLYSSVPTYVGTLSPSEQTVVEQSYDRFNSDSGQKLPSTYEEYFLNDNQDLSKAIKDILNNRGSDILLITAPAGYGKTGLVTKALKPFWLSDQLTDKTYDKKEICRTADDCSEDNDLVLLGQLVVNTLPKISDDRLDKLIQSITETNEQIVIIDGIDEFHSDSITKLIAKLKAARNINRFASKDIILFGRPEIVDELESDNYDNMLAGINTVNLNPQRITRDALQLRVKNYLDYKADKLIEENTDHDCDSNSICPDINDDETVDRVTMKLSQEIENRQYLADMLRLAFLSSLLIEAQRSDDYSLGTDDLIIREGVLHELRGRATKSHGRPSSSTGSAYANALISIAINVEPDDEGYFKVPYTLSAVRPDDNNLDFHFIPRNVLQRSGLVSVKPLHGHGMMRFEPIWVQSVLAMYSDKTSSVLDWSKVTFLAVILLIVGAFLAFMLRYISPR